MRRGVSENLVVALDWIGRRKRVNPFCVGLPLGNETFCMLMARCRWFRCRSGSRLFQFHLELIFRMTDSNSWPLTKSMGE